MQVGAHADAGLARAQLVARDHGDAWSPVEVTAKDRCDELRRAVDELHRRVLHRVAREDAHGLERLVQLVLSPLRGEIEERAAARREVVGGADRVEHHGDPAVLHQDVAARRERVEARRTIAHVANRAQLEHRIVARVREGRAGARRDAGAVVASKASVSRCAPTREGDEDRSERHDR